MFTSISDCVRDIRFALKHIFQHTWWLVTTKCHNFESIGLIRIFYLYCEFFGDCEFSQWISAGIFAGNFFIQQLWLTKTDLQIHGCSWNHSLIYVLWKHVLVENVVKRMTCISSEFVTFFVSDKFQSCVYFGSWFLLSLSRTGYSSGFLLVFLTAIF